MPNQNNFEAYSAYYDLLYADKPTETECQYVADLLKRFNVPGNQWLEFGAGSGRHAKDFMHHGVEWNGVDGSIQMAETASTKGLQIEVADLSKPYSPSQSHDAVISLFHVASYMTTNAEILQYLKNASTSLKKNGIFLFDSWYTPAVLTTLPEARIKEMQSSDYSIKRSAQPTIHWNSNTVNVHFTIQILRHLDNSNITLEENHLMRHFSTPEIQLLSNLCGFDLIHTEEWLTGSPLSESTWGACFVLRKRP